MRPFKFKIRRPSSVVLSLALALLFLIGMQPQPIFAVSPNVVISQVYGGGGNSGAPYTNDFVELFNRGTTTVSLSGWSIQYTSANGTGNFGSATNLITPLSGSLAPGQYLLVQEASQAAVGAPLPTPDVTDATPINMAAGGGKVALVNTSTPLGCNGSSTPCTPAALATIVDLVGLDGANFFEGSGAGPTTNNTTSAFRAVNGCTDTDNNAADFAAAAPNPRNTASSTFNCSGTVVSSTSPANNAINVAVNANVNINFNQAVIVTGSWFGISCATSGAHPAAVSGGPQSFALDPNTDFVNGEVCTVTIIASQVSGMAANHAFSFTTIPSLVAIHDIQGATHISPKNNMLVATTGIVIAKRSNGFHIQDPNPDSNLGTSEGLFIFTSSAPTINVGDAVFVTGTVKEFRPGGAGGLGNLTTTEIDNPGRAVTVQSNGNPLPAATVIGAGGRVPPTTVINDDGTGDVENSGSFDAATDGIDFYESLESMLVQVNQAVVVGPWTNFGSNREIPVIGDNGANASVRTARSGIIIRANDFNPERIILNDLIAGGPTFASANVNDKFPGAIVGVIDYSFGNFKLQVISMPAVSSGGLTQEVTASPTAYQLSVGTFNVENLAPTNLPSKFSTLATLIVNNLKAPDIIAVEEVQDNSGATNNGIVDATTTWTMLINAITTAGGPPYQFRQIDPVNNQDGGAPGGNIRQGFLFRTDRGLTFVDRVGGTSTNATGVTGSGASTQLTFSPGRIDPTNAAFTTSRKPLAGEFTFKGDKVFVVANHWNSKGGDQPLFGHFQPPSLVSQVQRDQQATIVKNFVSSLLAADSNANVVVLGDLNDFEFSNPLNLLKSAPLNDLIETLAQNERYTYVFEGNSQTLDHTLVSNGIFARPRAFDVVHVNSEFAAHASDHEPQVSRLCVDRTAPTLNVGVSPNSLWPPNHKYVDVKATVTKSDNADPSPSLALVSVTSNEPDNGLGDGDTANDIVTVDDFNFKLRAERSGNGNGRIYTITYRLTDACGNVTTKNATVSVPLNQGN
ncbi:MAG: lamin tail domain-containing protein [Chloroflexi bacterium]|nr:lamin tail domain-containing protein [Chloroflexota bacterium]